VEAGTIVGIVVGLLLVWLVLVGVLWLVRPRDVGLGELVALVPDVLRLVRDILADRSAPTVVRLALVGLLAWLVSPIDFIPEFVPVLGPLDDVIVAVLVLRFVRGRLGLSELRRRWHGSDAGFDLVARVVGGAG
jgi:uncharacterized membrane protein YkvA (DUF1232 family)